MAKKVRKRRTVQVAKAASIDSNASKQRNAAEDPMISSIRVAAQQIDAEPGGRLAWLLRFIGENPELWQAADREAHANRLLAFVYTPMAPNVLRLGDHDIEPLAPHDAVEILQKELREWLNKLVSVPAGVRVPVPTEGLEEALVRATAPGLKPAIFAVTGYGGPRRTLLFQAVKELVLQSNGRLIACQACGRPILALRKRLFCSDVNSKCLQTWHDREKAKRKGKGSAR